MRTLVILITLLVGAAALAQGPQKNADLQKAQKQLAAKQYADALKSLDAAWKKGGLDNESLTTLLESKGLAEASLKKLDVAEQTFRQLLVLDPRRDMVGKYKGDVVKSIEAALAWVGQNGSLQLAALDPGVQGGKVKQVAVSVKSDPLKLAKAARIYLKQDGGTWKPVDAQLVNGTASADTDGQAVEFWVEIQDASKNQLGFLGSAIRPLKQSAPAEAVAAAEPKKDAPEKVASAPTRESEPTLTPAERAPDAQIIDEGPRKKSPMRPVGLVLVGAGAVAAGIGTFFGVTSSSARSSILADQVAGTMTQLQLYERDQARIGQARIANGLFIGAGIAALAGVLLFFLGG